MVLDDEDTGGADGLRVDDVGDECGERFSENFVQIDLELGRRCRYRDASLATAAGHARLSLSGRLI